MMERNSMLDSAWLRMCIIFAMNVICECRILLNVNSIKPDECRNRTVCEGNNSSSFFCLLLCQIDHNIVLIILFLGLLVVITLLFAYYLYLKRWELRMKSIEYRRTLVTSTSDRSNLNEYVSRYSEDPLIMAADITPITFTFPRNTDIRVDEVEIKAIKNASEQRNNRTNDKTNKNTLKPNTSCVQLENEIPMMSIHNYLEELKTQHIYEDVKYEESGYDGLRHFKPNPNIRHILHFNQPSKSVRNLKDLARRSFMVGIN